ncbi:MAG TPA: porin, partial [Prolixibacteraceae bacterium]|nr:porin [Prolixibacteraceae bacterium]
MKKLTLLLFVAVCLSALTLKAQQTETLNEKVTGLNDAVAGINERLATAESDLSKLTKIKVSGYMQAQWQYFENPGVQPNNFISLRRARLKFTYEAADGVKFLLQPDFLPGSVSLREAYVVLNDRWTKSFSLWAGKFNRPNYEVEYSSSQLENLERSLVIRTLYPGEYALGAKLEYNPSMIPIHIQLALMNGNDGLSINNSAGTNLNSNENKDIDNYKDIMVRATYNLQLGSFGGLDFGAHGYFGSLKSNALQTLSSDYTTIENAGIGDAVKRNWAGAEFQLFADILGGLSVKGEYIAGKNASVGYAPVAAAGTTAAVPGVANFQNNFSGYYVYLIKNLGKKNQFSFRYDSYDPNTDIKGKDVTIRQYTSPDATTLKNRVSGKSDLATTTFSLALHHYFDDNLRISLDYDIVQNEKVGVGTDGVGNLTEDYTKADGTKVAKGIDYGKVVNNNVLTL